LQGKHSSLNEAVNTDVEETGSVSNAVNQGTMLQEKQNMIICIHKLLKRCWFGRFNFKRTGGLKWTQAVGQNGKKGMDDKGKNK
jgi:hypothetical protein